MYKPIIILNKIVNNAYQIIINLINKNLKPQKKQT